MVHKKQLQIARQADGTYDFYYVSQGFLDMVGYTAEEIKGVKDAVGKQIAEAIAFADAQPFAPEESAVVDVYSDIVAEVRER